MSFNIKVKSRQDCIELGFHRIGLGKIIDSSAVNDSSHISIHCFEILTGVTGVMECCEHRIVVEHFLQRSHYMRIIVVLFDNPVGKGFAEGANCDVDVEVESLFGTDKDAIQTIGFEWDIRCGSC